MERFFPVLDAHLPLFLQGVGALFLVHQLYYYLDAATLWLLPSLPLTRYQRDTKAASGSTRSWALVTGASAGIGLGLAHELARRGFNIVLHGYLADELEAARRAIQHDSPDAEVQVVVLDAIAASGADIDAALDGVQHLHDVTVVVNNLGGFPIPEPKIRGLHEYSAAQLDATLDINARFMSHVCRRMIPILAAGADKRKGTRGLLLNVSSAGHLAFPFITPYSGSKALVNALSRAVQLECAGLGLPVDVLVVVPGDVRSQMNSGAGLTPGSPDSQQYAACVLDRTVRAVNKGWLVVSPWWMHAVQLNGLMMLPGWVFQRVILGVFEEKKRVVALDAKKAT